VGIFGYLGWGVDFAFAGVMPFFVKNRPRERPTKMGKNAPLTKNVHGRYTVYQPVICLF